MLKKQQNTQLHWTALLDYKNFWHCIAGLESFTELQCSLKWKSTCVYSYGLVTQCSLVAEKAMHCCGYLIRKRGDITVKLGASNFAQRLNIILFVRFYLRNSKTTFSQDWQKKPFWRSDKGTFECLKYYSSLLPISQNRIIKSKKHVGIFLQGTKIQCGKSCKSSPSVSLYPKLCIHCR